MADVPASPSISHSQKIYGHGGWWVTSLLIISIELNYDKKMVIFISSWVFGGQINYLKIQMPAEDRRREGTT